VKIVRLMAMLLGVVWLTGCSTPAQKIKNIELGMAPGEVLEQMGEPYTIRAANVYEDGKVTEIWEYVAPLFTFNPRTFLVIFQDGKLTQWGVESDLMGSAGGFKR